MCHKRHGRANSPVIHYQYYYYHLLLLLLLLLHHHLPLSLSPCLRCRTMVLNRMLYDPSSINFSDARKEKKRVPSNELALFSSESFSPLALSRRRERKRRSPSSDNSSSSRVNHAYTHTKHTHTTRYKHFSH